MLADASVCCDSMLGKCVAGVSVVLAISLSSCSFLLIVDEVIKTNRKCHRLDRVTTRMSFAPPPYAAYEETVETRAFLLPLLDLGMRRTERRMSHVYINTTNLELQTAMN